MPTSSSSPTAQALSTPKKKDARNSITSIEEDDEKNRSSIQVVVRVRPMNEKEKEHGTLPVVTASTDDRSVTVIKGQGTRQVRSHFSFDRVFAAFSTQEEVFKTAMEPVISDVMAGYESTVFAYGQTGTGKTYTMEGDLDDTEIYGVIPRSAKAIFDRLAEPQYTSHTVTCSYLGIYNEELSDLLVEAPNPANDSATSNGSGPVHNGSAASFVSSNMSVGSISSDGDSNKEKASKNVAFLHAAAVAAARAKRAMKLEIMEGKAGTFCRGLSERSVESAEDVLALMRKAQQQRHIGETRMNKSSSRSHCLFTIKIQAKKTLKDGNILQFNGKLHLVDLAGSEGAKTASLGGDGIDVARGRERVNINRSLLTLGRVIKMLKEKEDLKSASSSSASGKRKANVFIPYRESKLTRILQEALGGRCKTVIIATLSPSVIAVEESMSTLNYAQWANGITNKPVSTTYLSTNPNSKQGMISPTKSDAQGGITVEDWNEMECRLTYMQAQVEEAQSALARNHLQNQEIFDRVEKAELGWEESEKLRKTENEQATEKISSLEENLASETATNKDLSTKLQDTDQSLKKQTARAEKFEKDFTESETLRTKENEEARFKIDGLEKNLASETSAKEALAAKLTETEKSLAQYTARAEKAEADLAERTRQLEEANATINRLNENLASETDQKLAIASRYRDAEIALRKTTAVLDATQHTELKLSSEATILLNTLKESLAEAEVLHSNVVKYRELEVEKRSATKNFNSEAVTILQDITECLSSASERVENYQSSVLTLTDERRTEDTKALDESLALVRAVAERVKTLTSTLDDAITATDDGLLVKVAQMKSNVSKSIDRATDTLTESEKVLVSSCESAREKLYAHAARVKEIESTFLKSSTNMLKTMEGNLAVSKEKLSELTSTTTDAIAAAMAERKEVNNTISSIVTEWNDASNQSSNAISDKASEESAVIVESTQNFQEESKQHDIIESTLSEQRSCVQSRGDDHVKNIVSQESFLSEQSFDITTAQHRQKQLCEDIINNVMDGVRELVTSQMDLLTKEQSSHFASLEKDNESLVVMNKGINDSAKDVFQQVLSTNSILTEKNTHLKKNDENAVIVMKKANNAILELQKSAASHAKSMSSYATKTKETLHKMEEVDEASSEKITLDMNSDHTECTEYLTETFFGGAKDDLTGLTKSGKDIVTYHNDDLIPDSIKSLDYIEAPRGETTSNLTSSFNQVLEETQSGEAHVRTTAQSQLDVIAKLQTSVAEKETEYVSTVDTRHSLIDARRETVVQGITAFGTETTSALSKSKGNSDKVKGSIQEFASKVLRAEEDVDPAPEKKNLQYSVDLSSTASKEEIHKTISFASIDKELFGQIGKGDIGQHLPPLTA